MYFNDHLDYQCKRGCASGVANVENFEEQTLVISKFINELEKEYFLFYVKWKEGTSTKVEIEKFIESVENLYDEQINERLDSSSN